MPRLIKVAIPVLPRIRQDEPETPGVAREPGKRAGAFELELERPHARGGDVDRTPGMVLAVPGRRAHAQDLVDRQAPRELRPHDLGLALDASEGGHDRDHDAIGLRLSPERTPRSRRGGHEEVLPAVFADLGHDQFGSFRVQDERARRDGVERDPKRGEYRVNLVQRTGCDRSTAAPRRTTAEMRREFVMSSSGLASSTMKSALLPACKVPASAMRRNSAELRVAATITCIGVIPAATMSRISSCAPHARLPSVPSVMRAPAAFSRARLRAWIPKNV